MAISYDKSGTAAAGDIQVFKIFRSDAGELTAEVTFKVTVNGEVESRSTSWALTNDEKLDIQTFLLPGVLAAIDAAS